MENRRPIRLSLIAVLVVVVLLSMAAYFIANRIVDASSPRLREATSLPATANQVIKPLGSGCIYYDGGTLHALDERGRQIWSYPAGSMADFSVGDGGVAVWSGTMLSLLNAQNGTSSYSGNIEGSVIDARFGKTFVAVQIAQKGSETKNLTDAQKEHNTTLLILDANAHQVDPIAMPNQTVLDFGFFSNDQLFWSMSLNTEGTVPICKVRSHKPGRMELGSFEDTEQVLYSVSFQSNEIRVVGDTYVKDYDYQGKEIAENRILVYGWCMFDRDPHQDNPMMVFVPISQADGTAGISDLRTIKGQQEQSIRLPMAAKQVFVRNDTVYAFSNERVMVCRAGAIEPEIYGLPLTIDKVVSLTDNHAAIVTSGVSTYMIPLP